jgi:hypothetical protein
MSPTAKVPFYLGAKNVRKSFLLQSAETILLWSGLRLDLIYFKLTYHSFKRDDQKILKSGGGSFLVLIDALVALDVPKFLVRLSL